MSIKDIIAKAKESKQDSKATTDQENTIPSNQDTKVTTDQENTIPSNQDTKVASKQNKKNKSQKDLARKVMNLDVPAVVKNYWMGQIKSEGGSFKEIVINTLIKKYGLPENWKKDDF